MQYEITERTTRFIAQWESFRKEAYWDATGKKWTVGFGHTRMVDKYTTCTRVQGLIWMRQDCKPIEKYLNTLGLNISQEQFDALVSFAFNVGLGNLKKSTLLRHVRQSAPVAVVEKEFHKWDKSGGKVLNGLKIRREGEGMLYSTGKYPTWGEAMRHLDKREKKE